ncbi:MAG: UbiD family decarboxylase [Bacillota bacterium]
MSNPKWSLASYLDELKRDHPEELLVISEPSPVDYFLTALVLEMEKRRQYQVVVVENPQGSTMPVVANIFASRRRLAQLAGTDEAGLSARYLAAENHPVKPVRVDSGPVKEVVETGGDIDIQKLPIMKHFESDAGRYITSGILVAKDPDTGVCNLSYHRMQVKGPAKLGVSLHSRQHLWDYFERAERRGLPLEVAVVIGAHPVVLLGASSKTSIEVDEYEITGALMGEPLELVAGESIHVPYPAEAEIVIEGRILPGVREPEGPFGEYTGYSTSRSTQNVFQVSAVCRRQNPLYLSVIPGYSMEHLNLMRVAKEALMLERLKERVSTVRNVHYPKSGANFHCYLSMKKMAEGTARQALLLLFGLDPYVKLAIAVDEDIDITDEEEVMWAVATRMQADRDSFVVPHVFCNRLDPSSVDGMSAKLGIDATAPLHWDVIRSTVPREWQERARQLLNGKECP